MAERINPHTSKRYGEVSFSTEQEEIIRRIASGDIVAKLELIKTCMNLVVKLANWYAFENKIPLSQTVQIGTLAIVKAAESFHSSEQTDFIDYASQEIIKAMTERIQDRQSYG